MNTYTFQDKKKLGTYTVKATFLEKCPTPENFTLLELSRDYNFPTYLHNENGPAVIRPDKKIEEFWLEGHNISVENPEKARRMQHNIGFDKEFNNIINSDDDGPEAA